MNKIVKSLLLSGLVCVSVCSTVSPSLLASTPSPKRTTRTPAPTTTTTPTTTTAPTTSSTPAPKLGQHD